jgi:hypothetical protein
VTGWQRALRLLHSAHPEAYLRRQKLAIVAALVESARRAEFEDQCRQQWLAGYHVYLMGSHDAPYPSFSEYLATVDGSAKPVDEQAEDEAILLKAKRARKRMLRSMGGG